MMEDINIIGQVISTIGFPIFVALFSLVKLDRTINNNTKVMHAIALKMEIPLEVDHK